MGSRRARDAREPSDPGAVRFREEARRCGSCFLSSPLLFLNLVNVLRRDHLDTTMETETLIRAVLTLPGERRITADTETIRIYPHKRDPAAMEAVEKATASLNKRDLRRGTRALRFELAPRSGDLPVG